MKPIENPVLHFGSSVAKDITVEGICKHFRNAGKGLTAWNTEIHSGMFEAMKSEKQTKDLRVWLYKQLPGTLHSKISGLLKRFVRILDSPERKAKFLSGEQDFWTASKTIRGPRSTKETYRDVVNRAAWCLIKQSIPVKQFSSDVQNRIDEINSNDL